MSCITRTAKYVILTFNYTFVAGALALIILGILYMVNEELGVKLFGDGFYFGIAAIGIGAVTILLSGMACFGALHQNRRLLTFYIFVLIALLGVQLAFGIYAIVQTFDFDDFYNYVAPLIEEFFNKKDEAESFQNMQQQFACCGANSYSDYKDVTLEVGYPNCCPNRLTPCLDPFPDGCSFSYTKTIRQYIIIVGSIAIFFVAIKIAGVIYSVMVRQENIRNELKLNKRPSSADIADETSI